MKAPYTIFGKTLDIPVVTYTDDVKDEPAKDAWDATLWVEHGEDYYGLMSPEYKGKTVRIIERQIWLSAERAKEQHDKGEVLFK